MNFDFPFTYMHWHFFIGVGVVLIINLIIMLNQQLHYKNKWSYIIIPVLFAGIVYFLYGVGVNMLK